MQPENIADNLMVTDPVESNSKTVGTGVAAIFDMDGTLVDNTPYHFRSWQHIYKKYNKGNLTKETYLKEISGVPIKDTLKTLFGADYDADALAALLKEKETSYKEIYKPFLAPVNGLENFLAGLKKAGIKMALASSATVNDIDFIFSGIPIRHYFDAIIDGCMVSKGKPNPQIFLKAAEQLNVKPAQCVVFEDSLAGIKAGKSAGMAVAGITTAHPASALTDVDLVIKDYTDVTPQQLAALIKKHNT